jgi:hypothetical protein
MAKGQQRDSVREAQWRQILARHGKSGLSVRAFCRREGLPESAWYAWRRTIQQRDAQRPAFVPVQLQPEAAREDGAIVVELRGGRVLRLPVSMPPTQLAAVVHALEQAGDAA